MAVAAPKPLPTPHAGTTAGSWELIVAPVRPFLDRVSARMVSQVDEFEPEIADYARYALDNQGKQLRPSLVALSGMAVGELTDQLVDIAVVIEMIHLATLVHDDIMDEARIRRGRATLATKWGSEVSVLVGDCLFAHALKMATNFPATDVCRAIAEATSRVCAGEILQTHRRRRWGLARPEYYKVLEMKTAELFGLACGLGVRLAGGHADIQAALRRYGLALGTAYQIYDDCLDLYGAENSAGKSLGTDLAKGKVTLPLLVLLERATPADRNQLLGYLESWRPEFCPQVRELLDAYQALPESIAVIHDFLDTARSELVVVENTTSAQSLVQFTDFLLQQTSALGV